MKKENIIYDKGGYISLYKTIDAEIRRNKAEMLPLIEKTQHAIEVLKSEIARLSKRESTPNQKQNLITLIDCLQNGKCKAKYNSYGKESLYDDDFESNDFEDISYDFLLENVNIQERIDFILKEKEQTIIHELYTFLMKQDFGDAYISEIIDENNKSIYFYSPLVEKSLIDYSVELLIMHYKEKIKKLEYNLAWYNYHYKSKEMLLNNVEFLYDKIRESFKFIREVDKQKLLEYLLINATDPDESEDEYNVIASYEEAANVIIMINKNQPIESISTYINELKYPIDKGIIYSMILNFGENTGLQLYKKNIVDPAKERYIRTNSSGNKEHYELCNNVYLKYENLGKKPVSGEDE